jgi:hypothetical protein
MRLHLALRDTRTHCRNMRHPPGQIRTPTCLKGPGPCAARNATQRIALVFVGEPAGIRRRQYDMRPLQSGPARYAFAVPIHRVPVATRSTTYSRLALSAAPASRRIVRSIIWRSPSWACRSSDNGYFEDAAREAAARKRWDFFMIVQLTRLSGGMATNFNALEIF